MRAKNRIGIAALALAALSAALCLSWQRPASNEATIIIDAGTKGPALSEDLYGVFFEDINHASDGGLYAELVQNRDFEYDRQPEGLSWHSDSSLRGGNGWRERYGRPSPLHAWKLQITGGARAEARQTDSLPLNESNPVALELNVTALNGGSAAIANGGYWGIPVRSGETYLLSFYGRCNAASSGKVSLSIENMAGKVYAAQTFDGLKTDKWTRFEGRLVPNTSDSDARLVIRPLSTGRTLFDMVSLFPQKTYRGRPNGLRADLAEMMAGLKPSFLRFPGGCVVEGATLENRVKWYETIGDPAQRPGNWNLWRYHSTAGLGYHEFLQLCEDLGAAPMYVVNVGMACQARTGECAPASAAGDYLQETLDALEYAMAPAETHWGGLRAKAGHPNPFAIKYIEIGNENRGPYYQDAYKRFYTALRKSYPRIRLIANEQIPVSDSDRAKFPGLGLDIVDEHYYKSSLFFANNSNRYDSYPAAGPKIYIGEFAVNTPDGGRGNLRAALGEASFMTGMERNADKVVMASYAPTFVHANDRRWMPDLIVFDGTKAYGTPSYYGFQMFSQNRPDYVVPVSLRGGSSEGGTGNLQGGIGFTTRNASIAYKDIQVLKNGKDLLQDDLRHGTGKWTVKADNWRAENGVLRNAHDEVRANIWMMHNDWKDYSLRLKTQKISGDDAIHIAFLNGGGGACVLNITANGTNLSQNRGDSGEVLARNPLRLETGRWYDVAIDLDGTSLRCTIDGTQIFDTRLMAAAPVPEIFTTAGISEKERMLIVKIVNTGETAKPCAIQVNGRKLAADGEALVMTGSDGDAENSFDAPRRIAPEKSRIGNISGRFTYTAPPRSVTILRLPLR